MTDLELRSNALGSSGPNYDCVDGKFERSSAGTGHGRDTQQAGSRSARRRLYVTSLLFGPKLVLNSFLAPLLEKDCAVCKDQFSLQTEDPDEHIVITLPCKHPFHSPCIVPWLKQNGTCPSCRYQLVPQPGSTPNPNQTSRTGPGPSTASPPQPTASTNPLAQQRTDTSSSRSPAPSRDRDRGGSPERSDSGGGFLGMVGNLLHSLAGGHPSHGPVSSGSGSGPGSLPGSWESSPGPRPESGNRTSHSRSQSTQPNHGTYPGSGPARSSPSHYDRLHIGSAFGSSFNTSPNNRDRSGDPTPDWASHTLGRRQRGGYDRERDRNRDRNGQRRNAHPWENPELD